MRLFFASFILIIGYTIPSLAQNRAIKFYDPSDQVRYDSLSKLVRRPYKHNGDSMISITTDSGMISLSRRTLLLQMAEIPSFQYLQHKPSTNYIPFEIAIGSAQKDTIRSISLSGDSIEKIPSKLYQFKQLQALELVNTAIDKLPWRFNWHIFGLRNLKKLHIYNYHGSAAFRFRKNDQLTYLDYSDNPYAPAPTRLERLSHLEKIKMVNNDLQPSTRIELNKLKKLTEANFRNNHIRIEQLASNVQYNLSKLILTQNGITGVPEQISHFPSLKELQLAENNVNSDNIHPKLGTLEKLEMLSFYKNELTYIPEFIFKLENLTDLDLYHNAIEVLPEEIAQLTKLERLYLADNRIFRLPERIGELSNLQELYLKQNRISYLPESMTQLSNITDFHISNNYLQAFPTLVLSYKKLKDLDISFNEIHDIPEELLSLEHLSLLWMKGITFEARNREQALEIKNTIEGLQAKGVNVGLSLE